MEHKLVIDRRRKKQDTLNIYVYISIPIKYFPIKFHKAIYTCKLQPYLVIQLIKGRIQLQILVVFTTKA